MRSLLHRSVLLVALLSLSASKLSAAPILINFEGLDDAVSVGSLIPGVTFTNATSLVAGISLNDLDFPPVSGSTVAFDSDGPIRVDFSNPVDLFSGYFTYVTPLLIQAFDSGSGLLGSVSSASDTNLAAFGGLPNELLSLSLANISYVMITGSQFGGSFTLDDVSYNPMDVPEPGTVLLVGMGFALLARKCYSARRSQVV